MAFDIIESTDLLYLGWFDYYNAFQVGAGLFWQDHLLNLFNRGCLVGENEWNCTKACLDLEAGPKLLWNSEWPMFTLANCISYPYIARMLAAGNLTDEAVDLTEKYKIRSSKEIPTVESWPVITNCVDAFCEQSDTPGCSPNSGYLLYDTYVQFASIEGDLTAFPATPFVRFHFNRFVT